MKITGYKSNNVTISFTCKDLNLTTVHGPFNNGQAEFKLPEIRPIYHCI